MYSLFIDTTYNNFHLVLLKNENVLDNDAILQQTKISDLVNDKIAEVLDRNKLKLADITNFYVTKGPGSYTGVRAALTIVKTIKTIVSETKVFMISSLLYQAGTEQVISCIDARGGKLYCGIYDAGVTIIPDQLLEIAAVNEIASQFPTYKRRQDFVDFDYVGAFLAVKPLFTECKTVTEIEPTYIKSFI